jgi:hypothetical protein
MRLKYRLQRLERLTAPAPCTGPGIEIVECYEGEEPPPPKPCRCGGEHPGRGGGHARVWLTWGGE